MRMKKLSFQKEVFFCLDFEDMQTSVLKKNTQKPNNNRDGTSFLSMIQEWWTTSALIPNWKKTQ